MDESTRQYLSTIGAKGGKSGVGAAKARTTKQAKRAAMARWKQASKRQRNSGTLLVSRGKN